jgi:two-component system sensor histidine kinase KdpD
MCFDGPVKLRSSRVAIWGVAIVSIALVTAAGKAIGLNASAIGFAYLIVVLLISLVGGLLLGTCCSVLATLCYNFFFFPPLHTLVIEQPANWFALAAFLVASVTVNRLVVAARVQAAAAEERRRETQRLIEELAHVEALRESEALKTSLLRAISHDLATPLTAITIRTESLRRHAAADGELRDAVAAIAAATARLRRRIDNLLSMARLEAGKAKPRREPVPPADLFRAVRENLPLVFAARPATVHVDDDCPDADVDPSLALEILVNLVENAHRVSPPGAPLVLRARIDAENAERMQIEVLDRGPGVPADLADVAQRGLGLEIARSLAAANGGSVALLPREGGGTIARIDFPAAPLPVEGKRG